MFNIKWFTREINNKRRNNDRFYLFICSVEISCICAGNTIHTLLLTVTHLMLLLLYCEVKNLNQIVLFAPPTPTPPDELLFGALRSKASLPGTLLQPIIIPSHFPDSSCELLGSLIFEFSSWDSILRSHTIKINHFLCN